MHTFPLLSNVQIPRTTQVLASALITTPFYRSGSKQTKGTTRGEVMYIDSFREVSPILIGLCKWMGLTLCRKRLDPSGGQSVCGQG